MANNCFECGNKRMGLYDLTSSSNHGQQFLRFGRLPVLIYFSNFPCAIPLIIGPKIDSFSNFLCAFSLIIGPRINSFS